MEETTGPVRADEPPDLSPTWELLRRSVADEGVFPVFVAAVYPWLISQAYGRLRHQQDAENVTQEVLLAVYRGLANINPAGNVGGLVYCILRNKCNDVLCQRGTAPTLLDPATSAREVPSRDTSPAAQAEADDETAQDIATLQTGLVRLKPRDRQVIEARLAGEKNGEIAEEMGMKRNTVAQCVHRAFHQLAEHVRASQARPKTEDK